MGLIVTVDSAALRAAIQAMPGRAAAGAKAGVVEASRLIQETEAAKAPKGKTKQLAGSVRTETADTGLMWSARIGPTVVYSRRIAIGFHGVDKIGRRYDESGDAFVSRSAREVPVAAIYRRNIASALGV